ncbi:MAG: ATP-binding cassette domain-containing protein, partial [Pseudomonadota bacterium]
TRPSLYVLDEPTAALQDTEVEKLFRVIERLKADGAAILYVSHRIAEILAICDDVTVLRNGHHIRSCPISETGKTRIIRDMIGKDVAETLPVSAKLSRPKKIAQLAGVSSRTLRDITFDLREGEVLGLAGLAGAGQTALLRLLLGLEPVQSGSARLLDAPLPRSTKAAWARGVAYVPEERRSEGLMMRMGVRANALLPHMAGFLAQGRAERRRTRDLAEQVGLKSEGPEQSVWQLSGGNQQKVVFARALAGQPKLLLLDEPTRGVDIGARFDIYALIRDLTGKGCSCLLASSDLPELLTLSDRILVLQDGRQVEVLETDGLSSEDLLNRIYHHQESQPA